MTNPDGAYLDALDAANVEIGRLRDKNEQLTRSFVRLSEAIARSRGLSPTQDTSVDRYARRMELMTAVIVVNGLLNWTITAIALVLTLRS